MTDRDYWRVAIAIPPGDREPIIHGAPRVLPSERHAVITDELADNAEAAHELVIDTPAETEDEARAEASTMYARVRNVSGLPPTEADFIGVLSPLFGLEVWQRLWNEAVQLHNDRRYDLAVVRVQTGCECLAVEAIEGALRARLGPDHAAAVARLCKMSLADGRTRRFLADTTRLAPSDFNDLDWWGSYSARTRASVRRVRSATPLRNPAAAIRRKALEIGPKNYAPGRIRTCEPTA